MNIFYDHQIFSSQNLGGASRYFAQLIAQFQLGNYNVTPYLGCKYSNNSHLIAARIQNIIPCQDIYTWIKPGLFKGKGQLYNIAGFLRLVQDNKWSNVRQSRKFLKNHKIDLYHYTLYYSNLLKETRIIPKVITIHDMTHEKFPHLFGEHGKTYAQQKKNAAHKADFIITDSKKTRDDVIDFYGISQDRVEVVYLGYSSTTTDSPEENLLHKLPENFLLYVGTRSNYKNFNLFLKGCQKAFSKIGPIDIVCIGGGKFTSEENEFIRTCGLRDRICQYSVNESTLQIIYSKAIAFIYPSLYEGFGLPILEAWNHNCPVLLLNSSCFPEIGDNAAHYFENDPESLALSIESVLSDHEYRKQLVLRGSQRLKLFTWDQCALKTAAAYKRVVNER